MTEAERPVAFDGARRVVVKIGSAVLRDGGAFDRVTFASIVCDICALRVEGLEVVVVCSGAVALGLARLGRTERPTRIEVLQATAAVGQARLMRLWNDELSHYGAVAGQLLLTHDDVRDRRRFLSARHTLRALLELGAVPVINENDTVAIEEIKMGDNDLLSSQVVSLVGAGMLVVLSDVDGLYDAVPSTPGATRLTMVDHVDADILALAGDSTSGLGSGGMRTKVMAMRQVNQLGVPAVIADGKFNRVLQRLYAGEVLGTWFAAAPGSMGSRKHWIAFGPKPKGALTLDTGAVQAVRARGGSLLPIGICAVEGDFGVGDSVRLLGPDGVEFARGLAQHDAMAVRKAMGARMVDTQAPEVVHRDDLALVFVQ